MSPFSRAGSYPKSLSELVPHYVNVIKPPRHETDGAWKYWTEDEGREYELGYSGPGDYYTAYYGSRRRKWQTDTK